MTAELPARADVAVLGGGITGLAIAHELARRDVDVVVLGRSAATDLESELGMLNPQARVPAGLEVLRDLLLLARHLYGDWVAAVEEDAGISCELDTRGGLMAAATDAEEVRLDRELDWQRGRSLAFEVLSAEEARVREPSLSSTLRTVFAFPGDAQVAPASLLRALELAARRAGARFAGDTAVVGVGTAGSRVSVETLDGVLDAETVVDVREAGEPAAPGSPALPLRPGRLHLVGLSARDDPDRLGRFVSASGVEIVPRRDGTVVLGSPATPDGSAGTHPVAAEVARLLERAWRVVPAVAGYPVLWTSSALRLFPPDGLPAIGETRIPGLFVACGLGNDVALLAPAVAVLLAELLSGQTPPLPAAPFAPARLRG